MAVSQERVPSHYPASGFVSRAWCHTRVRQVEELQAWGAGLEAIQLSRSPLTGTLVHMTHDGMVITSGSLHGKFTLQGPIAQNGLTIGFGLQRPPGSRHWLQEVETGVVTLYGPGSSTDALYCGHSMFLAATVSEELLTAEARRAGRSLPDNLSDLNGLCCNRLSRLRLARMRRGVMAAHENTASADRYTPALVREVLASIAEHLDTDPTTMPGSRVDAQYSRIVRRARDWIDANLDDRITLDAVADAAITSRRTLQRAFAHVLDESICSYVMQVRLHRIRHHLITQAEAGCTIASVANRWGISELGRLSARYRDIFGELPSQTLNGARQPLMAHDLKPKIS